LRFVLFEFPVALFGHIFCSSLSPAAGLLYLLHNIHRITVIALSLYSCLARDDQSSRSISTVPTHTMPPSRFGLESIGNPMETYTNSNPQNFSDQLDRVCIIGSGNWGSAIAKMVGANCERYDHFEDSVNMWVFDETVTLEDGSQQLLTEVINTRHENVKYLPGIKLPNNIKAVPDLAEACRGATLLIFVLPHQFLPRLMPIIRANAHQECRGVSLIKGLGEYAAVLYSPVFAYMYLHLNSHFIFAYFCRF
jgi:hypothetical protein